LISASQKELLCNQLGREPVGAKDVSRTCPEGHPLVVRVGSVVRNQPFPTLFWLSCPQVKKQIDSYEAAGAISFLQALVDASQDTRAAMQKDHETYSLLRESYLTEDERRYLEGKSLLSDLARRGIGGLKNTTHIRCLHMHFAYHLINPSTIGTLIQEHFPVSLCPASAHQLHR